MKRFSIPVALGLTLALATGVLSDLHADVAYFVFGFVPGPAYAFDLASAMVVPLMRPEDIGHARALQAKTPGIYNTIPVMKIAAGADGINRNYLAVGAPQWSWHVTEFLSFAEGTVGSTFDTIPASVEYDVAGFIEQNGGELAFSSYSLIFELSPASLPVTVSLAPATNGIAVTWTSLGVDYVYTIEVSDSVASPNWAPAQGTFWPSDQTRWVDAASSSLPRVFIASKRN